ncbi:hypothetical protein NA57DRAFT_77498 [Rhizodiscina lignyota]|uniref:Heterokaryon incompatibility domain-containing protein n=1 Tax=Rhizodiscina lignyota TaxID=1504668 RepID=A0A9P4IAQ8_9PEZI|nr:hypothetical protein NA57DRAFT_77498 [Rhizodiscina lignyota]
MSGTDSCGEVIRKNFKYCPLQGQKNIRLVEITFETAKVLTRYHVLLPQHDKSRGDVSPCRKFNLIEASLDEPESVPVYTALSYAWGDRTDNVIIEIDSHPLGISRNLADALDNVIEKVVETSQYLWVDQISINQQDQAERSSQVRYMSYIYEKSASVCVWLGNTFQDHTIAIDILSAWKSYVGGIERPSRGPFRFILNQVSGDQEALAKVISIISSDREWNAINKLSQSLWWERAWVVQEATGPAPTYCMCGRAWIPFPDLIGSLMLARLVSQMPAYFFKSVKTRRAYCMLMMADLRAHRELRLLDALQFLRTFSCTDPRDKVYAILGLVDKNEDIIVPDYSNPLSQVYTDVVRYCIAVYPPLHRLNFLAYVSGSSESTAVATWPSFVPNWNGFSDFDIFKKSKQEYKIDDRLYSASLDSTSNISLEGSTLTVDAFEVDTVSEIESLCPSENDVDAALKAWKPKDPNSPYRSGGTNHEAYLHTLVGDVLRTPNFGLVRGAYFQNELLKRDSVENFTADEIQSAHHMRVSLACNIVYRRFFRTKTGFMGIGPASMQVGDKVFGFLGGQMLYIVRCRLSDSESLHPSLDNTFVGECYVEGLMDGQGVCYSAQGSILSRRLSLL